MRSPLLTTTFAFLVLALVPAAAGASPLGEPFVQQAELTSSDGAGVDLFGASMAVSGNTLVVLSPSRAASGTEFSGGAAYVFERGAGGWANARETAELTLSKQQGAPGSVAISGNTIVLGVPSHNPGNVQSQGAAYVFVKPARGWKDARATAELTATDGTSGDSLGASVAVSGDTVVAGALQAPNGNLSSVGAAYVFVKPSGAWTDRTQTAKLTPSDPSGFDAFAGTTAISGGRILVGAPGHKVGDVETQGAAYVYAEPDGGWVDSQESAQLTIEDKPDSARFGAALAISGDTAVVGASDRRSHRGASYVFVEPAAGWRSAPDAAPMAELTASDGADEDLFGFALSMSGDTIAVGAPQAPVGQNAKQGAVYLFSKPPGGWRDTQQVEKLTAADGVPADVLGAAVASTGAVVFGSAPLRDVGDNQHQGVLYAFASPPAISIDSPADGATFTQGQAVAASFACSAAAGATIASCSGDAASGAALDTQGVGTHAFAVTATHSDGTTAKRSVSYTVTAPVVDAPTPLKIPGLKQSRAKWRGRVGTTFSSRLTQPAGVTLRFTRRGRGAGTLKRVSRPGANHVRF